MVLSANDEEVASSKKHTQFKTSMHKPYPISDQKGRNWYPILDQNGKKKNIPFGAAHTYIAYIREYPQRKVTTKQAIISPSSMVSTAETCRRKISDARRTVLIRVEKFLTTELFNAVNEA